MTMYNQTKHIMKNLLFVALIVSAFACSKKEEAKVDPTAPKTGKFEYTFTAQPESQDRPTTVSFNFYSIKNGVNVNIVKTFVLTNNNNVAKWDTTVSANKVTGNVTSRKILKVANFEAKFNGVTIYNEQVGASSSGTTLLTKDL